MQTIKKVWNVVTTVLVTLITAVVLFLIGTRLFGLQGYTVLSGSMEPVYQTGSVIYVKKTDAAKLEIDDVITFYATGRTVATHRIVEVVEEDGNRLYRTKGDVNEIADGSLVEAKDVIGTPIFSIPYLGYALFYIQSTRGRYLAIAVGAMLLLMIFLPSLIFDGGNKRQKTKLSKEEQK